MGEGGMGSGEVQVHLFGTSQIQCCGRGGVQDP